MRSLLFACLLAIAATDTVPTYSNSRSEGSAEFVPILRDDRNHPEDGTYSFDIETGDGIIRSEAGARLDTENRPVGQQGHYSFTFPNGEEFELKFVANENGFQPESTWLPVAPEFPHPIPDFVLEQIEKARIEDEEAARSNPQRSESETYVN